MFPARTYVNKFGNDHIDPDSLRLVKEYLFTKGSEFTSWYGLNNTAMYDETFKGRITNIRYTEKEIKFNIKFRFSTTNRSLSDFTLKCLYNIKNMNLNMSNNGFFMKSTQNIYTQSEITISLRRILRIFNFFNNEHFKKILVNNYEVVDVKDDKL